jgi:hypothetical protein
MVGTGDVLADQLAQAAASLVETRRASAAPISVRVGGRAVEADGIAAPEATVLPAALAAEVRAPPRARAAFVRPFSGASPRVSRKGL